MSKTVGIVVFPGSNCDHDTYHAMKHILGLETKFLWHKERSLEGIDLLLIPGGFSYGDYLRSGAIARFSPIMEEIIRYANAGKPVLGICNGFQTLLEAGLLPGAMLHNRDLRFICKQVWIRTENTGNLFTRHLQHGEVLRIPVSHGEGNYTIDPDGLKRMKDQNQILFRYCNAEGKLTPEANVNGSVDSIAAISNESGNVVGMMPHPERAVEQLLGSDDGLRIFESIRDEHALV